MSTPNENLRNNQVLLAYQQHAGSDPVQSEYADVFTHMRITDEARARAKDVRGLWTTANNTISHLSSHFVTEPNVDFGGAWVFQLQNLWHLFYVAGKHCSEETMAPMVLLIIETSQRGILERSQIDNAGNAQLEHAPVLVPVGHTMVQQYIWQDLPLMVPDMATYWVQDCAHMSRSQRTRISFFWASLVSASTSLWSYSLCRIALLVLRDTLEFERRLVRAVVEPGGDDGENMGRTVDMLTIADLMPAVNAWVVRAGGRLAQMCMAGDSNTAENWAMPLPEDIGQPGPLAEAAGISAVPGGFSSQRWLFWLRRLDEIGTDTSAPTSPDGSYTMDMPSPFVQRVREEKNLARRVAHNMIYVASQSNSPMVHELMRARRLPIR